MQPGMKLSEYRRAKGLSAREAASQMGVSHVAVLAWESGQSPAQPYRELIERWSGGELPRTMWPPNKAERDVAEKLEGLAVPTDPPSTEAA